MNVAYTFRGPHNLYRRYQGIFERILTASALAVLVTLIQLYILPVYPENWVLVTGVTIAILGIRWPLLAYIVAVAAMIYPLYLINLYLAVLFVAVSALGQRTFVHYMGATVLVLATPLLAEYHLHWLVPILGGLWWGGATGAWIGALAAFWGKFLGSMAGQEIDWLLLAGHSINSEAIVTRFQDANSLETLVLLIEPFALTATVLLYNLLQIIGWMVAGAFVGSLAGRKWVKYRAPWSILVITAGGGLIMLATHLALPYWLSEAVTAQTEQVLLEPAGMLFSLLIVIIVGTTVYTLREMLDLPVAPSRKFRPGKSKKPHVKLRPPQLFQRPSGHKRGRQKEKMETNEIDRVRRPIRIPHQSELPEWEPPQEESGLIMLEID